MRLTVDVLGNSPKISYLFSVFEIIVLEPVAGISLKYCENTCDR